MEPIATVLSTVVPIGPRSAVRRPTITGMAVDVHALIALLREDSEQRTALRAVLLGDEAPVGSALERLAVAQERATEHLRALTSRVEDLALAQGRTEHRVEQLAQAQTRTEQRLDALSKDVRELALAQQRTESALKSLVDVVAGINDRVGKLDGYALEQRYRDRGHAYFAPIARRLRFLDGNELSVLVDDAQQAGVLTERDADAIQVADAVFTGLRREDRERVHLVAEVSVTIGRADVRRARERADLLERVVATPVIAVVAGEYAPGPVAVAAHDADVWRVTNGHVVAPGDDEPDD